MNAGPSSNGRRYLALWFPWLPSERLRRGEQANAASPDAADPRPVVMVEKVKGALRLAAIDPAASRLGLSPGMTLADARARTPELRTIADDPDADATLLRRVLKDFGRFTPLIALDPPLGLMLDVTGCAHLFGDEAGLIRSVRRRATGVGLSLRWAMADTPQSARALARFGPGGLFAGQDARAAVRRLSVAALELAGPDERALRRAGLKRLSDLDDRPRAPMAARFGTDFPARLARVLGDEDVRITPHRPVPACVVDRILVEPIVTQDDVERVFQDLVADAVDQLDQRGQGGRAFEVFFYRLDGHVRRISIRTGQPSRDPAALQRLFRERLGALAHPLDPGFGFDQIRLAVPWTEPVAPTQDSMEGERPGTEQVGHLIDRLAARLGPEAVLCFQPFGSHMPERSSRLLPSGMAGPEAEWPEPDPEDPPLRPLQMFDPPQPVETLAEVPDGSPLRFRWRRVLHQVVRSEGPERIAGEWWRAPDQRTRDYYRVEDTEGRRFWLFRQGLYGQTPEPRWFIHGLFA